MSESVLAEPSAHSVGAEGVRTGDEGSDATPTVDGCDHRAHLLGGPGLRGDVDSSGDAVAEAEVESSAEEHLRVSIVLLSGAEVGSFRVRAASTALELKRLVISRCAILSAAALQSVSLVWKEDALSDTTTLHGAGVRDGDVLQVIRLAYNFVTAVVRCRPLLRDGQSPGDRSCVFLDEGRGSVRVDQMLDGGSVRSREIQLDAVYSEQCSQEEFFNDRVLDMVDDVLRGVSVTIFAYGQTGSGRRHTIFGSGWRGDGDEADSSRGLLPRAFERLAASVGAAQRAVVADAASCSEPSFTMRASFFDIIQEHKVLDLLASTPDETSTLPQLKIRQSRNKGVFVEGLTARIVTSEADLRQVMCEGLHMHSTWVHKMGGVETTRSHMLFTVIVEFREKVDGVKIRVRTGSFQVVVVAACERAPKPNRLSPVAMSQVAMGPHPCAGLLRVVDVLSSTKKSFVPYRDSALTHLLRDSLGGSGRTLFIIHCLASECCFDETLSALRFAERVRKVQNEAAVPKEELLDAEALSDDGRVIPASIDRQEEDNASGATSSRPA